LLLLALCLGTLAGDTVSSATQARAADIVRRANASNSADTVTIPDSTVVADSVAMADTTEVADSAAVQEDQFQESLDSLFSVGRFAIDTFAWSNDKINSGRFDFTNWNDTTRIVLVDSAQGLLYAHAPGSVVTSNFGQRRWLWHYGVDTRLTRGDTVRSAFDGIVRVIQYDRRGYGNVVVVRHPNGLETVYGHLSKKLVMPNQKVRAGDALGLGGNTGHSTGPHLHLELRYFGEPFDPNWIIDFENHRLKGDTLVLTRDNFEYLVELRKAKWLVVRTGDTLGHIARRTGTTITKLCALNHITRRTLLRVGRKLRYQ
jgi:murein DD-endopeptidase MepM/ murein hydrolase activator NlpD